MARRLFALALALPLLHVGACASDESDPPTSSTPDADASVDRAAPDSGEQPIPDASAGQDAGADAADGSCPPTKVVPDAGETCIGFGKKADPCDPACGLPAYGYVCFGGQPPGFAGCVQARASSLGETYCCPENKCVAQPDQDGMCAAVQGKPHRYQCPPLEGGGNAAPPAGCTESGSGGTELEKFYCCPP